DEVKVGDYVILHAGFAIQKLDEKEAQETIALLNEVFKEGTKAQSDRGTKEMRKKSRNKKT
ncbi:MAG: HypC/HybG/HupF family hydrogenase formation chaperone, partial [Nitrospirae bacterium]|nr:HypC/HybG/HupF family hydrogenase formation chaperone [Nitrospirota bacterium]